MQKLIAIALTIALSSLSIWAQEKEPKKKKELKTETFSDTSGTGVRVNAVPKGTKAFERIRINPDKAFRLAKAYEYYEAKNYQFAQYLLEDLLPVYRGKPEGEKIFFHYAYTHFYLKNFTFAAYYFKQFHTTFPNSSYAEEALYMAAEGNFQMSPGYRHTQEETMSALEGLQLFVNSYPQSTRVLTANQKMDKLRAKMELKDFENAKGYLKRKQYRAAIHTLKALMVDYPETQNLEEIRFLLFAAACKFAQNSVPEKQVERYEEAFVHYNLFVKKHPQSPFRADADQLHTQAKSKLAQLQK
jgi:outer membrane protein assembly factor BamD